MPKDNRFAFTKTRLDNLPIPNTRTDYHDTSTSHLKLTVTTAGTKTFYLYRKIDGRPERFKIGRFPSTSVEHARRTAARLNGQIANGTNPQGVRRSLKGEHTLGQLFKLYVDDHLVPRGKRTRTPSSLFKTHFADWAGRKLSSIKATEVQKHHAKIGKKHPAAANRAMQLLRALYNKAIYWGHFKGENPADRFERFKETPRRRFLHPDEMAVFFDALATAPPTFRDFVLLCLFTGARRSNIQAMRWVDINFERAEWVIPETKNGEPHLLPLVPQAMTILEYRQQDTDSPWVLPSHSASGHYEEPKRAWETLLNRAGIDDLRIHDLRRTVGSWQAALGTSLPIIGATLGHQSVQATAVYARLSVDPVRQSLENATRAMVDQVKIEQRTP